MPAYVFTHATVLDGTEGMEPQPNMTVVVNGGRIEATGRHEKLLDTCPLYREMWQAHMGVKEGEQA